MIDSLWQSLYRFRSFFLAAQSGILACSLPAYGAMRVDPMVALRYE